MSIASKLNKLIADLEAAYAALESKGATIPTNCNYNNLADAIESISGGGFGKPSKLTIGFSTNQEVSSTTGILLWNTHGRPALNCTVTFSGAGGKIVGFMDYTSSSPSPGDSSSTVQTYAEGSYTLSLSGFIIPNTGGTVKVKGPNANAYRYAAVIW